MLRHTFIALCVFTATLASAQEAALFISPSDYLSADEEASLDANTAQELQQNRAQTERYSRVRLARFNRAALFSETIAVATIDGVQHTFTGKWMVNNTELPAGSDFDGPKSYSGKSASLAGTEGRLFIGLGGSSGTIRGTTSIAGNRTTRTQYVTTSSTQLLLVREVIRREIKESPSMSGTEAECSPARQDNWCV
jgi:hypothetical protein